MREIARRTGVSEQALAFGRETLDPAVAERVRAAEAAEGSRSKAERARAYQALSPGGFQGRPHAQRLSSSRSRRRQVRLLIGLGERIGSQRWGATPTSSWSEPGSPASRRLAASRRAGRGVVLVEQFGARARPRVEPRRIEDLPALVPRHALRPACPGGAAELARARSRVRRAADRPHGRPRLRAEAAENARALAACGVRPSSSRVRRSMARWPFAADPGEQVLFQPDGGTTLADRALSALLAAAVDGGAVLSTALGDRRAGPRRGRVAGW